MMKKFKFLGAFFVGLIGLISFGYCLQLEVHTDTVLPNNTLNLDSGWCVQLTNADCCSKARFYDSNGNLLFTGNSSLGYTMYCMDTPGYYVNGHTSQCTARSYDYSDYCSDCVVEDCPAQYDSSECQQVYSLMPISSCNNEYCELNGMCGVSGTGLSELYINGINHLSAPEINLLIPLEYQWDYVYTGNSLDISISGYNVDYEYIDNIIRTQNSKPNDTDFNNIVSGLIPLFVPGLVLILFILFIFRFIKKIF